MSKNNNIITINGKEYDVFSGRALDGSEPQKPKSHSKQAVKAVKAAPKKQPAAKKPRHKAKSVAPHAPKSATTLMRKSVKKPSVNQKRSIKANGELRVQKKVSHGSINTKLLGYAKRVHRSPLIKHFSNVAASDLSQPKSSASKPSTPTKTAPKPKTVNKKPKTTAELLDYAIAQSTSHEQAPPPKKSRNPLKRKS